MEKKEDLLAPSRRLYADIVKHAAVAYTGTRGEGGGDYRTGQARVTCSLQDSASLRRSGGPESFPPCQLQRSLPPLWRGESLW